MLSFKAFLINEDYKTTAVKFVASGIDKVQVDDYILKFKELSNKQKLAGEEKNIDTWAKKTFLDFKNFVDAKEKEVTDAANKKAEKKDPGESIDITSPQQRYAGWNILIPLDKKASCYYGNKDSMSDWCVAKAEHDYFHHYFYEINSNLIFCLDDNKKEKWAIEIKSDGSTIIFYDIKDNQISKSEFEKQTKLKFTDILRSYKTKIEEIKAFKFENISLAKLQKLKSKFPEFPDATLETWHTHPYGGGWVQNTAKVSDNAYVGPDAIVYGNAVVSGNARVFGNARVYGDALISENTRVGDAQVYGKAKIYGNAWVAENAEVSGSSRVSGNAEVSGFAKVFGNAEVSGFAKVFGNAEVSENAQVFGNAVVLGYASVSGRSRVSENARVSGNAKVYGEAKVFGNALVRGLAWVTDYAQVSGDAWVGGSAKVSGDTRVVSGDTR